MKIRSFHRSLDFTNDLLVEEIYFAILQGSHNEPIQSGMFNFQFQTMPSFIWFLSINAFIIQAVAQKYQPKTPPP